MVIVVQFYPWFKFYFSVVEILKKNSSYVSGLNYQIQHCFECILRYFTVFNLFCEIGFGYEESVPIFDL